MIGSSTLSPGVCHGHRPSWTRSKTSPTYRRRWWSAAQAAAPSVETDRLAADIMLFGGDFVTVLNLVLPPDCLPQTGGSPSRHTGRYAHGQSN